MNDISNLLKATREVVVDYKGLEVVLQIQKNCMTPAYMSLIQQSAERPEAIAEALALAVIDWDITNDNQPWPPTVANFLQCPIEFLTLLFERIHDETLPSDVEFPNLIMPRS